jgi:lipopolysaccharide cholinephosphotransferase
MPESMYFPAREVAFEGQQFMAPGRLEDFLTRLYGDRYMELPPPEKRVTHQIRKLVV